MRHKWFESEVDEDSYPRPEVMFNEGGDWGPDGYWLVELTYQRSCLKCGHYQWVTLHYSTGNLNKKPIKSVTGRTGRCEGLRNREIRAYARLCKALGRRFCNVPFEMAERARW